MEKKNRVLRNALFRIHRFFLLLFPAELENQVASIIAKQYFRTNL